MKLEFNNVSQYKTNTKSSYSLKEVHFSIADGHNLAILTHQDSIRTLMMKLILSYVLPDKGKIHRAGSFSTPLGDFAIFHGEMTVEENIRFVCKLYGKPSHLIIPKVANFTEYGERIKKKVKIFSPPERRKITLALNLFLELDMYVIRGDTGHPEKTFKEKFDAEFSSFIPKTTFITITPNMQLVKNLTKSALVIDNFGEATYHEQLQIGLDHYNEIQPT